MFVTRHFKFEEDMMKNQSNEPGRQKLKRRKSLAVGKACTGIVRPTLLWTKEPLIA